MHLLRFCFLALLASSLALAATAERSVFATLPDGKPIDLITLANGRGATAQIITFGASIADLRMPDRNGTLASVVRPMVATPDNLQKGFPGSNSIMGRVTNRIANARFLLDGKEVKLTANVGKHHIHGGRSGFGRQNWSAEIADPKRAAVTLSHAHAAGEDGYPGTLQVLITYELTEDNTLRIDYKATTDAATPINLTNHAYFNLAGGGDVLDHELTLATARYTVSDAEVVPTGEIAAVTGALDFTKPVTFGANAAKFEGGRKRYDHNFVIDGTAGKKGPVFAARVREPKSGRSLEVWTTEPGVQLYTSELVGAAPNRQGFYCLETQHFPDAVNHANFPSTILRPGETFRSTTEFRFGAK